jgi:hypothetical protein
MAPVRFDEDTAQRLLANGSITPETMSLLTGQQAPVASSAVDTPDQIRLETLSQATPAPDPFLEQAKNYYRNEFINQGNKSSFQSPDEYANRRAAELNLYRIHPESFSNWSSGRLKEDLSKIQGGGQRPEMLASSGMSVAQEQGASDAIKGKVDPSTLALVKPVENQSSLPKLPDINSVYKTWQGGVGLQGKGIDAEAQAVGQLGAARSDVLGKEVERQQQLMSEFQRIQEQANAYTAEKTKEFESDYKQLLETSKINPNRLWEEASTPSKITAGIAIVLGGIGGAITGKGGNAALEVIQNAIQRDVDAQRSSFQNRAAALQGKQTIYAMNAKKYADQREALLATMAQSYRLAATQVDQMAAKFADPEAKAKAMQLKGALMQNSAQIGMQLQQMIFQRQMMLGFINGGATGSSPYQGSMIPPKDMEEFGKRYVPGMGLANSEDSAKKVIEYRSNVLPFKELVKKAIDFNEKYGGLKASQLSPELRTEAKALATELQNAYRVAQNMGVYKESEAEFAKAITPESLMSPYAGTKLKVLYKTGLDHEKRFYEAHGFVPRGGAVQTGPALGASK